MVGKEVALIEAIRCGDTNAAIKLITKNTTVVKNVKQSDQRNMQTLKSKINVNFQNEQGLTSLHQACISGNSSIDLVTLLLDCGSRVDTKDIKGYRPIHFACQNGKSDLVNVLLRYGANPNEPTVVNADTPMHLLIQHTPNNQALQGAYEKTLMFLLTQGASTSLTVHNLSLKQTPFEMACELGKTRMIEIFIRYFLSTNNTSNELIRSYSTNSLLLAAKNGHDDIIRLLLVHDLVDLNHTSPDGSALHEACRYGRYQTAKLLLESGIDMSLQNSYKQTAIDVVIKQKIGNDLKCLIKEFAQSVRAVSVAPHLNSSHPSLLNFSGNELIVVLERPTNGTSGNMWRGFILDKSSYTSRSGYFPSSHVKLLTGLVDSSSADSSQSSFKVGPFVTSSTSSLSNYSKLCSEIDNMSAIEQQSGDQTYISQSQLEKIVSKSSTATNLTSFQHNTGNVNSLSPSSSSTSSATSSSSFSRATISSSAGSKKNVSQMKRAGLTDNQIIHAWLSEQGLEQYYDAFIKSGYDLLTIVKATPADLCALGVIDPAHRARLKQNTVKLDVDELEDRLNKLLMYVRSVDDMLKLVGMEEYAPRIKSLFIESSFGDLVKKMSCEDLEEMGIEKLGHQKKLMLVIKKLKEIQSQSIVSSAMLPPPIPTPTVRQSTENLSIEQNPSVHLRVNNSQFNQLLNQKSNVNKQQPPIPPRISSILMQPTLAHEASNYATLPRNRKSSPNNKNTTAGAYEIAAADTTKQPHLTYMSASNPSSPFKPKPPRVMPREIDSLALPPPMPIISLAPPSQHKIVKRSSPFTRDPAVYSSTSSNLNETSRTDGGGVLSDLDSMLCDLNRQLDAMLNVDKFSVKS